MLVHGTRFCHAGRGGKIVLSLCLPTLGYGQGLAYWWAMSLDLAVYEVRLSRAWCQPAGGGVNLTASHGGPWVLGLVDLVDRGRSWAVWWMGLSSRLARCSGDPIAVGLLVGGDLA